MRWIIPKPILYYSVGVTVVGTSYLLKDYLSGDMYSGKEELNGKVAIVTGSNTGIGKQVAHDLAKRGATVLMACRDMEKCETARSEIVLDTKNKYVYCRKCDLASQESIRKFVNEFKKKFNSLHILINNAGVMRCPKSYTKEGIEMHLGVNHMGHFLLTNLLLDVLKNSAPARVINVTSTSHKRGNIKLKDLNSADNYEPGEAYAQSKLANILFTRELANKLKGTGVTVNAVHPGIVKTDIMRHMGIYQNRIGKHIVNAFTWIFIKSPIKGAQPILHVALDPSLKDITGAYFDNFKMTDVSDEAKNDEIAKWLWEVSTRWTKLYSV